MYGPAVNHTKGLVYLHRWFKSLNVKLGFILCSKCNTSLIMLFRQLHFAGQTIAFSVIYTLNSVFTRTVAKETQVLS